MKMRLRIKQKVASGLFRFSPLILLGLSGIVVWLISVYYGMLPEEMLCHLIKTPCSDPVDFRREIAYQLKKVIDELQWSSVHKKPISPRIHLQIAKILSQLDPRLAAAYANSTANKEVIMEAAGINSVATELLDVCPEKYMGARYSYPFQQDGFLIEDCANVKPLQDVITIVINTFDFSEDHNKRMQYVLEGINITYPKISVLLGTKSKSVKKIAENYPNVGIIEQIESYSVGKTWNALIKEVKTPYVLLARDIAHFNSFAALERQIRVLSQVPHVKVAGGAFRNMNGHWHDGCYQSSIRNYFLKYTAGYEFSKQECMFCDYIEGPFVAKTDIFTKYSFHEHLPASVIFADWFLEIKDANYLVFNCPDVMYFIWGKKGIQHNDRKDWQELGKWWEIHKIFFPPQTFSYTCKEVLLSCDIHKITKSYIIPPCCSIQYSRSLAFLEEFSSKHGLPYELEAGSNLGAVKIHDFIPWDLDGDITFHISNYTVFKNAAGLFKSKGFALSKFEDPGISQSGKKTNGYFNIYTPDIYLEMWGYPKFSTDYLPIDLRDTPTKVSIRGVWVRAQSNPGLYARNRYGYNYLRHAQFWGYTGMSDSWENYDAGKWMNCPRPSHHACLDRYPVDGNMDFIPDNYP